MQNAKLIALFLALPSIANAASPIAPQTQQDPATQAVSQGTPSEQLAALQAQIPILKAKAEIAEYQAKIRNATNPQATALSASPLPPAPASPSPQRMEVAVPDTGIQVASIRAYDGQFAATLEVNGSVVPVRRGDTIEGGWTISGISASQVQLTRKGVTRVVRL